MKTREERKKQLEAMMHNSQGQDQIIALYQQKVVGAGKMEQVGIQVSQMIALILAKEFPDS